MPDNVKNRVHTQPETPLSPVAHAELLPLQLTSCVTLGRWHNLSVPCVGWGSCQLCLVPGLL